MKSKPITLVLLVAILFGIYGPSAEGQAAPAAPPPSSVPTNSPTAPAATGSWRTECVDCPMQTWYMRNHFMRVDRAGNPHIAYGINHLYYASYDGTAWRRETVDPASGVGANAALALDANDHAHISYRGGGLRYARWTGNAWDIQIVDTEQAGGHTSLALDAAGNPHISYLSAPDQYSFASLKYAHWTGSAWKIETIENTVHTGLYSSLALDAAGRPHISYYDSSSHQLKYAHWTGSAWDIQDVGIPRVIWDISMALDATGRPHIAYYVPQATAESDQVMYARWTGSAWDIRTVEVLHLASYGWVSMDLDANGNPHIIYLRSWELGPGLKYARWTGSGWDFRTLATEGIIDFPSLALDAVGVPHVAYLVTGLPGTWETHVKHAQWTGTTWDTQTVDITGAVRWSISLALDAAGYPRIGYADTERRKLKYARWTGSTWNSEVIDTGYWDNVGASLALDSSGSARMSYFESNYAQVKYARQTDSGWNVQIVDTTTSLDPDKYTSLGLDAAGNPHISYTDGDPLTGARIQYATWTGSAWITTTVGEGWNPSMKLDSTDRPHIGYYGTGLKYARLMSGTWAIQTVDTDTRPLETPPPSLVLDSSGNPHISYCGQTQHIKYARWTGTAWDIQAVDEAGVADYLCGTSLVLDATGNPRIAYYDDTIGDLRYARWTGSKWDIQTVDSEGDIGFSPSLALDAWGAPHIGYIDRTDEGLKFAVQPPTLGFTKTVSPVEIVRPGESLTYTLTISGPAVSAQVWDPLPSTVEYVAGSVTPPAIYNPTARAIVWQGTLPTHTAQVIRFQVTPVISATGVLSPAIVNMARLTDRQYARDLWATVIVNGWRVYLPIVMG